MRRVRLLFVLLVAATGALLLGLNLAPRQSPGLPPARASLVDCRSLQGLPAKLQVHYLKASDGATAACATGGTPCQQALALHLPQAVLASAESTGICARRTRRSGG